MLNQQLPTWQSSQTSTMRWRCVHAESATTYLAVVADEHHTLAVCADLLGLEAHVEGGLLPGHQVHVQGPHLQGVGRVYRGGGLRATGEQRRGGERRGGRKWPPPRTTRIPISHIQG